jgi:imidazolonepropionase-like amidohydrolase
MEEGAQVFAPLLVPGAALHEELRLYAGGGLTPEEVLAIGTRGSARALGVEGLGAIAPDAPADFAV